MKTINNITKLPILLLLLLTAIISCKKEEIAPQATMTIDRFYPNSGPGGTLVTIEGAGFGTDGNQTTVNFNGSPAKIVNVKSDKVIVQSPLEGTSGTVTLTNGSNTVKVGEYTYQDLSIHEITPNKAPVGANIRIKGGGFAGEKEAASVKIGEIEVTIVNVSDTVIVIEIPEEVESGQVSVRVDGKESIGEFFTVQKVTEIQPKTGGVGTRMTILGAGFEETPEGNTIKFGEHIALIEESASDRLVVIVPENVTTGPVIIEIGEYTFAGPVFTVVPPPTITAITPTSGPADTEITIEGSNFSEVLEENVVTINGHDIPVIAATATRLTVKSPGNMGSGNIIVNVNGQIVEGPRFLDQNLGISRVFPEYGSPGMRIKVYGFGFQAITSQNIVLFNGIPGEVIEVTPTELTVIVPQNFSTGALVIKVGEIEATAPNTFHRGGIITLAGGPTSNQLQSPNGLVLDSKGNLFVADAGSHTIKKITPDGEVSVFAGSVNVSGYQDGRGTGARFNNMIDLVIDQNDNLYTATTASGTSNYVIRKIDPNGNVSSPYTTNSGSIQCLSIDPNGHVYYSDGGTWELYRIDKSGTSSLIPLSPDTYAYFSPYIDVNGVLYIGNMNMPGELSKGSISAGITESGWIGSGWGDFADGVGASAKFNYPGMIRANGNGDLIVQDWSNLGIRKVNPSTKQVTTLARSGGLGPTGVPGFVDGPISQALFGFELKIAPGPDGIVYFLDMDNRAVRMLIPE